MNPKTILLITLAVSVLSGLSCAATLSVTPVAVALNPYSNTGSNITMLNLTLNLTLADSVNITNMIVSFNSTGSLNASQTNLSVCLYNSTLNLSNLLGCSANWNVSNNTNQTNVTLSTNLKATNTTNSNMLVVYEVYRNVTTPVNISLYILGNSSITLNSSSVTIDNSTFPIASNFTQIQDLHATAIITPHYVDTGVVNQTLIYTVNMTGRDRVNKTIIYIPNNYSFVKLTSCLIDLNGDNTTDISSCDVSGIDSGGNQINVTQNIEKNGSIRVYFSVNTSGSEISNTMFNSTIDGGNLTSISTNFAENATSVATKQLLNATNQAIMKSTAIINGSDYWLFNITFNITAPVNGTLQFNLTNWTTNSGNKTMAVANSSNYYFAWLGTSETTVRNKQATNDTSGLTNLTYITNSYGNSTHGIALNYTGNPFTVFFKMIIPNNQSLCCYADWWSLYTMIFRT